MASSINISPNVVNPETAQQNSPGSVGANGEENGLKRMTYGRSGGSAVDSPNSKRSQKRQYQLSFCGPKMNHLKKRDGEALWREDIQYDFLHAVFTDPTRAFTNPHDKTQKCTFADIYLDAMARSSKCSKILAEKLLGDRQAGIKIAMVCLLVNSGRMNTTLNFFPEMKTQLRTYHPIPSLQTDDTQDYKQLQDAPRLKSILKGACEGVDEVATMDGLHNTTQIPRANPISLVFLMSTWAYEVKREMFPDLRDLTFFDLIVDTSKTSHSRARAFLWLIWTYMESPEIKATPLNPFGASFPAPEPIDPHNFRTENVDPPAELVFGNQMSLLRLAILNNYNESNGDGNANTNADVNGHTNGNTTNGSSSTATSEAHTNANEGSGRPEQDSTTESKETQVTAVPLIVPKTRMRSAKDRRINDELNALVRQKREYRKEKRHKRANPMKDLWRYIEDSDPLYDSDDDVAQAKIDGKSHGVKLGVLASGLKSAYSDYGELCMSRALSLKRAAKRIRPEELIRAKSEDDGQNNSSKDSKALPSITKNGSSDLLPKIKLDEAKAHSNTTISQDSMRNPDSLHTHIPKPDPVSINPEATSAEVKKEAGQE